MCSCYNVEKQKIKANSLENGEIQQYVGFNTKLEKFY